MKWRSNQKTPVPYRAIVVSAKLDSEKKLYFNMFFKPQVVDGKVIHYNVEDDEGIFCFPWDKVIFWIYESEAERLVEKDLKQFRNELFRKSLLKENVE